MENISREDNNFLLNCVAENSVGMINATVQLFVQCESACKIISVSLPAPVRWHIPTSTWLSTYSTLHTECFSFFLFIAWKEQEIVKKKKEQHSVCYVSWTFIIDQVLLPYTCTCTTEGLCTRTFMCFVHVISLGECHDTMLAILVAYLVLSDGNFFFPVTDKTKGYVDIMLLTASNQA